VSGNAPNEKKFGVHPEPIWRDRADFAIRAPLAADRWEQMAARQVGPDRFEICCIPFFAHDLALGDIVQTAALDDARYEIREVIEPSGHYTFRVWLGDSPEPRRVRADVMDFVTQSGCMFEQSSEHMIAIDAPPGREQPIAEELSRREQAGELIYETGKTGTTRSLTQVSYKGGEFERGAPVRVAAAAPAAFHPGHIASVLGFRLHQGTPLYTIEYQDGSSVEVPGEYLDPLRGP